MVITQMVWNMQGSFLDLVHLLHRGVYSIIAYALRSVVVLVRWVALLGSALCELFNEYELYYKEFVCADKAVDGACHVMAELGVKCRGVCSLSECEITWWRCSCTPGPAAQSSRPAAQTSCQLEYWRCSDMGIGLDVLVETVVVGATCVPLGLLECLARMGASVESLMTRGS